MQGNGELECFASPQAPVLDSPPKLLQKNSRHVVSSGSGLGSFQDYSFQSPLASFTPHSGSPRAVGNQKVAACETTEFLLIQRINSLQSRMDEIQQKLQLRTEILNVKIEENRVLSSTLNNGGQDNSCASTKVCSCGPNCSIL